MSVSSPPPKPRKGFPLFAHKGGSWTAKINGKQKSFGGWRGDPTGERALARYNRFLDSRGGDRSLPAVPDMEMSARELANRFLTRQAERLEGQEIRPTSFRDFQSGLKAFVEIVGAGTAVGDLGPVTFAQVRLKLLERMKSHALNRHLTVIKQMFRWGSSQGIIASEPKYGESMKKARHGRSAKPKLFSREDIWTMLHVARQPLRAMILLGLNCGLGNTDIGQLRRGELDLAGGMLGNIRQKTEIKRRCPLWPETVASINDVLAADKRGSLTADDYVFITKYGNPWVQEPVTTIADKIQAGTRIDSVRMEFTKVLITAGIFIRKDQRKKGEKPDGRNFYTLRRTFRTLADNMRDPHATALMMGHSTHGSVAGLYVQHIDDARLERISEYVRARVFGGAAF